MRAVSGGAGNANRWAVVVTPRAAAAAGGLTAGAAGLLGAAVLLLVGVGAILVFARRIVVGVRGYSAVAQELAAGDLAPPRRGARRRRARRARAAASTPSPTGWPT